MGGGDLTGIAREALKITTGPEPTEAVAVSTTSFGDAGSYVTVTPAVGGPNWLPFDADFTLTCIASGTLSIEGATGAASDAATFGGPATLTFEKL